jgi:hypothetical protein
VEIQFILGFTFTTVSNIENHYTQPVARGVTPGAPARVVLVVGRPSRGGGSRRVRSGGLSGYDGYIAGYRRRSWEGSGAAGASPRPHVADGCFQ